MTDLILVTQRPSFVSDIRKLLADGDGIRLATLETSPRPDGLHECLNALDGNPTSILLLDAEVDLAKVLPLVQEIFDRRPAGRVFVAGPTRDPESILRAHRAGASEFLPVPVDRRHLIDAVQRLWKRMTPETDGAHLKRGRVLSFLGMKGGCGTTTVATNLAVALAEQGHSTLLVDLDFSSSDVALLLNLNPSFTMFDVVRNAHRLDRDLLNGMIVKHASGLEILAAGENGVPGEEFEASKVVHVLSFLREQYDCVVVNGRDPQESLSQMAATHSDLVHLVGSLDLLSLRRAQWGLRRMADIGISKDVLRLVINRYDKNPFITLDEAEKVLELKVAWTIPADTGVVLGALNDGVPFVTQSRNGLRDCFDKYARTVLAARSARAKASQKRGFLGLFGTRGSKTTGEGSAVA